MQGLFGSFNFEYVKIAIRGCDLGSECFDDKDVMEKAINYISMKAHPSLLSDDLNDVITYTPDETYYKFLDP